jgi:hypothetical protein
MSAKTTQVVVCAKTMQLVAKLNGFATPIMVENVPPFMRISPPDRHCEHPSSFLYMLQLSLKEVSQ